MNWLKKTAVVVGLMAMVGGAGTFAYAQTTSPDTFVSNNTNRGLSNFQLIQDSEDTPNNFEGMPEGERRGGRNGGRHGGRGGNFGIPRGIVDRDAIEQATADALGLSVEALQEARENGQRLNEIADEQGVSMEEIMEAKQAVVTDAINQAVADGELTQEEADEIFAHMALRETVKELKQSPEVMEAVADALGISVDELEAAREEGTKLHELADAQGVDIATVKEAGKVAFETAVNDAVADGSLTQEQADDILSGEGCNGGRGGRNGGPRGNGQNAPQPELEDALFDA